MCKNKCRWALLGPLTLHNESYFGMWAQMNNRSVTMYNLGLHLGRR